MLIAIAAMTIDRVIGKNNTLPRHIPEDLKRFKELTTGHTIVMGRKTYESLPERFRPLPNRENIIITTQYNSMYNDDDITIFHSIEEFTTRYEDNKEKTIYIIGGSQIYTSFLSLCDELYISEVHDMYKGDTYFPTFKDKFEEIQRTSYKDYDFVIYKKRA